MTLDSPGPVKIVFVNVSLTGDPTFQRAHLTIWAPEAVHPFRFNYFDPIVGKIYEGYFRDYGVRLEDNGQVLRFE